MINFAGNVKRYGVSLELKRWSIGDPETTVLFFSPKVLFVSMFAVKCWELFR